MPESTQKYELSHPRPCKQIDISWDGLQFLCIGLCRGLLKSMSYPIPDHAEKCIGAETMHRLVPEPTQQSELSHPRPCRKIDIRWDDLQFLCIGLCRSLLKSMSYPIPDHADKIDISSDGLQFLCIGWFRSLLKSMSYPIPDHAEKLISAETVFNF